VNVTAMPHGAAATPAAPNLASTESPDAKGISSWGWGEPNPLASVFHNPSAHVRSARTDHRRLLSPSSSYEGTATGAESGAVNGLIPMDRPGAVTDDGHPGDFCGCDSRATFETGAATWILLGVVAVLLFVGWLFGV